MNRALCIRDASGCNSALVTVLLDCFKSSLDVAEVVKSVKYADYVNTVLNGKLNELLNNFVVVVLLS